ncbi:MAG: transglutaminase-like domain-containing protein [Erysipelotrichaceae bacterium]|jgi:hypothetical protein
MKKGILSFLIFTLFLSACTSSNASSSENPDPDATPRTTVTSPRQNSADGAMRLSSSDSLITLDYSHTEDGYVMIESTGSERCQIQITNPDGELYPYPLKPGQYEAFPLTKGNGTYQVVVLQQVSDNNYAIALSQNIDVTLSDEFEPFLYPNQYVSYTPQSKAVVLSEKLSDQSTSDLSFVQNVYDYVISHITYDDAKAENTPSDYIPDIDETLSSGKGICFDYAALMSAMLRCQEIPTKLEVGYSGDVYHAWISVYLKETGWVNNIISFDGKNWTIMDPTLGANNDAKDVRKYVGDGKNYQTKYIY